MIYLGEDVFTLRGLLVFEDDSQRAIDYLWKEALGYPTAYRGFSQNCASTLALILILSLR